MTMFTLRVCTYVTNNCQFIELLHPFAPNPELVLK